MTLFEFRDARRALAMTQNALAKALESDLRTVQRWEGGERKVPGPVGVALRCMLRLRGIAQDRPRTAPARPAPGVHRWGRQ